MKKILEKILVRLARLIVKKYQPRIVGITGSIGKTSTKEAIFAVLKSKLNVRQNIKNYNNEIGVPLTIIGAETGGRSLFKWLGVFGRACALILFNDKNYPKILILEMGADHPGDIEYLTSAFPCTVGVVTKVAPVHLEFFGTIEKIASEKKKIVSHLRSGGAAILNYDDVRVRAMAKNLKASAVLFGYDPAADLRVVELERQGDSQDLVGLKFKLVYRGSAVPVFIPGVIGRHQIYAAMAAAAVGVFFGLNLLEVSEALRQYRSPKGRMNIIQGSNNSLIIDDTYNSSPEAAAAALETVGQLNVGNVNARIAIMGDMLELGELSVAAHRELGKKVAEQNYNFLFAVGQFKKEIAAGATAARFLGRIILAENLPDLIAKLKEIIQPNDLLLVKGSQGVRLEKVVAALMRRPELAGELLVRQGEEWD
jgi:UDP-N-acetylmuramoyl-tripeptide--D-alanyl-D-alanine ligase